MGGEAENNKNRLIETYNDYKKMIKEKGVQIDAYDEFKDLLLNSGDDMINFFEKNKLPFPSSEEDLLNPKTGLFAVLTEDQAIFLS